MDIKLSGPLVLNVICSLFLFNQRSEAQPTKRLRVWVQHSAAISPALGNMKSESLKKNAVQPIRLNQNTSPTIPHEQGEYLEVDTAVAGIPFIYYVTNTNDTGAGSFRKAIIDANSSPGVNTIEFSIGSGVQLIVPETQLPNITSPVVIDGTTQPGYSGTPLIEISGYQILTGLTILAGHSTVRGLDIHSCQGTAIYIEIFGGNVIESNFIGINTSGNTEAPNQGNGIFIFNSPNKRDGSFDVYA